MRTSGVILTGHVLHRAEDPHCIQCRSVIHARAVLDGAAFGFASGWPLQLLLPWAFLHAKQTFLVYLLLANHNVSVQSC